MNAHIITGGSSIEADGVFSWLTIGREVSGDHHETTCHIIIKGTVAEALLLGENRDISDAADSWKEPRCGPAALDDLLAVIARWADARLERVLAHPGARSGLGVIHNYGSGRSSCSGHPLETPAQPNVVGLDKAQELAQAANQAAA